MFPAISINGVTKQFGSKKALKGISLQVNQGDIFGFLGPNGAGKTTTIRCMMDFLRPDKGRISLLNQDSHNQTVQLKREIGYLPAENHLIEQWNSRQHIAFYSSIKPENNKNISQLVKKLDISLNTTVNHMSSGNRQKLSFILSLIGKPKLLILDEPTRGLDPMVQNDIYEILKNYVSEGGTVFISSHNLSEVERICTSFGIIREGKIVADKSMDDVRKMKIHLISVTLETNDVDKIQLPLSDNIKIVSSSPSKIMLRVQGNINPILRELTRHKLIDLEVTHVPLEDLFMNYYK